MPDISSIGHGSVGPLDRSAPSHGRRVDDAPQRPEHDRRDGDRRGDRVELSDHARLLSRLRELPEVQARNIVQQEAPRIRECIAADAFPKSDDGLKAYMAEHPDSELDTAWAWTTGVNATVADMVHGVPPFPYVRESLAFLADKADMIVVSATCYIYS